MGEVARDCGVYGNEDAGDEVVEAEEEAAPDLEQLSSEGSAPSTELKSNSDRSFCRRAPPSRSGITH